MDEEQSSYRLLECLKSYGAVPFYLIYTLSIIYKILLLFTFGTKQIIVLRNELNGYKFRYVSLKRIMDQSFPGITERMGPEVMH
jgi:hypothetical protein